MLAHLPKQVPILLDTRSFIATIVRLRDPYRMSDPRSGGTHEPLGIEDAKLVSLEFDDSPFLEVTQNSVHVHSAQAGGFTEVLLPDRKMDDFVSKSRPSSLGSDEEFQQ